MVLLAISFKEFKGTLAVFFKILEYKFSPSVLLQSFNSLELQQGKHSFWGSTKHSLHHRPQEQECPRGIQSCHWHPTPPGKELFSTWHKSVLSFRYGAVLTLLRRMAHFPIQGEIQSVLHWTVGGHSEIQAVPFRSVWRIRPKNSL